MAEIKIPLPTNEQIEMLIEQNGYETSSNSIRVSQVNRVEAEIVGFKKDYLILCDKPYTDFALNTTVSLGKIDTSIYKNIDILVLNTNKTDATIVKPQISIRLKNPYSGWFSYLADGTFVPFYRLDLWGTADTQYESIAELIPSIRNMTYPEIEVLVRFASTLTSGNLTIVLVGEK